MTSERTVGLRAFVDGGAHRRIETARADRLDQAGLIELLVHSGVQARDDQSDSVAA